MREEKENFEKGPASLNIRGRRRAKRGKMLRLRSLTGSRQDAGTLYEALYIGFEYQARQGYVISRKSKKYIDTPLHYWDIAVYRCTRIHKFI